MLRSLLQSGVNVCRLNGSHSSHESLRSDVARIRRAAADEGLNVAILLDLQGPKIRTTRCPTPLRLESGDTLTVVMDPDLQGSGHRVGTTWPTMADDVAAGEPVFFADGALSGTIAEIRRGAQARPAEVDIHIEVGGALGSGKGINLPQTLISAPSLTDKDRADLLVGVRAGVDYVALSFVRSAADVADLRAALADAGEPDLPIIAKIEKPQAVSNIEEILDAAQGIMVARGDLGVEIPLERVPVVQKALIAAANRRGRLVITATQMLDSMERNPRPTRAEITDVANAILDGTDAVMLSGETAMGAWPEQAVRVMDRIARQAEGSAFHVPPSLDDLPTPQGAEQTLLRAAAFAIRAEPRPLVVFTWSGSTALVASKFRPAAGIFAITYEQPVADSLALAWGVQPLLIPAIHGTDDLIASGEQALLDAGFLSPGQEILILVGRSPMRGAANMLKFEELDGDSE